MADVRPFRALRPRADLAAKVASPPYDVLSSEEARVMADGNPYAFLHVSKPEIDMPAGTELYSDEVYAKARENFDRFVAEGVLFREDRPAFYLYQQQMNQHVQIGLVAGASVVEYERDLIRKHELTRRDKEDDRTRHIEALNTQAGPVFLTYHARPEIDSLIGRLKASSPTYSFAAPDGIGHTVWVVDSPADVAAIRRAFGAIDRLYVADGHHRSAAATRVCSVRRAANPGHTGDEAYNHFLAVIFPHDQMKIMAYNRVVHDLLGRSPEQFLHEVSTRFVVEPGRKREPAVVHDFGMYLGGAWYRLTAKPESFPSGDPVKSLDVSILQDNLLAPILGIHDPRTDKRIDFVGGIRGLDELEKRVHQGMAVAFALHPTTIEQLMSVADSGMMMPPKSTWFEPKLRSGLVVRPLSD
ncbi:DUF1015 domain-containing protein [Candidatus Fermentibacteria bacterium]|nr:DUF1015 domain-containing protein [Candidatus Fermentibacteria bacterium]